MFKPSAFVGLCMCPWFWVLYQLVFLSNPAWILNLLALSAMVRAMVKFSVLDDYLGSEEKTNVQSENIPDGSEHSDEADGNSVIGQQDETAEGIRDLMPGGVVETVTEPGENSKSFERPAETDEPCKLPEPVVPLQDSDCAAGVMRKNHPNCRFVDEPRPKFISTYLVSVAEDYNPLPSSEFFYNYRYFYHRHRGNWREMRIKRVHEPTMGVIAEDSQPLALNTDGHPMLPGAGRKSKGVKKMLRGLKKSFRKFRCF